MTLQKAAGVMYPMALLTNIADDADPGDELGVHVAQRDAPGNVVGGAAAVFLVE